MQRIARYDAQDTDYNTVFTNLWKNGVQLRTLDSLFVAVIYCCLSRVVTPVKKSIAMFDRQKLRALRKKHGPTQSAFAAKVGMDATMLSKYENGKHVPELKTLLKITEKLGLPITALLTTKSSARQ